MPSANKTGNMDEINHVLDELVDYTVTHFAFEEELALEKDKRSDPSRIRTIEMEGYCKDGSMRWTEAKMTFLRDSAGQVVGILGVSRDITERKRMEEELRQGREEMERRVEERTLDLRKANEELKSQRNKLEEVNTALRVLLERREKDKTEVEEAVLRNLKELILPYIEKLKGSGLDYKQGTIAEILESNLREVVSPFSRRLSSSHLGLTPTEIKVAALIRQGKTSKEIAELFTVSPRTIEAHRESIRKKMGLKKKKANLRTYLLSIE